MPQFEDLTFKANAIVRDPEDRIYVELFGDSIMCGRDPDRDPPPGGVCANDYVTGRVPDPPDQLLQLFLPEYQLDITTRSVGGSTSGSLLSGTDGVNAAWPDDIQANIVVINHGMNDARLRVSLNEYRNNLIALRQGLRSDQIIVWQTPTPSIYVNTSPYASTMINVAVEFGDIVSPAHAIPNWLSKLPDGIHPRQLGYVELVDLCLSNAVNQAIIRHLGTDQHQYLRKNYREKFILQNQTEVKLGFRPRSTSLLEIYQSDNPIFQAISRGEFDLYGILNPGVRDYRLQVPIFESSSGYNLTKIKRDLGRAVFSKNYDLSTEQSSRELASELNSTSHDYIVIITTAGDASKNRLVPELVEAIVRCGAGNAIFQSENLKANSAYILVGIPGSGLNGGYEAYSGEIEEDSIAYAELIFEVSSAGSIVIKDIFPAVPKIADINGNKVTLVDPMYSLVSNLASTPGTRIINPRYPTYRTGGIPYETYNIAGDTVYFNRPMTGIFTAIADAVAEPPRAAITIPLQNIHSLNYYVQRFNPARWAPGNVRTTSTTITSQNPLAPPVVDGAAGVNDLNLFNTQLYQRVGDAHYAEPILVSPPEHGTVCISANRKSFTYTPHAGYVGWDSFTYTMLTQHGQAGMPRSIFIEVAAN